MTELQETKLAPNPPAQLVESAPHGVELTRRGAVEREDRLLLVTHRQDRALARPSAGTSEELTSQRMDDLPLPGARVLRLVDQHVVDAAIELVVHPGRFDPLKQRQRLRDQVVVIEETAPRLLVLITLDHGRGQREQRAGAVAAGHCLAPLEQGVHALLLGPES